MRDKGLLTSEGALHPDTRVATIERGVIITADWNKVMHTDALDCVISVTEHLTLGDALTDGAVIAHPDSVEDLLSHLEQIHQCNASGRTSQVVGINTEFDASSKVGRDKQPILRLIGLCYVSSKSRVVMISVNMKVVGMMAPNDATRVTTQLRDLFVRGQGRMAAFDFT